jgi:CRP-like cAMP-binding protein
MIDPALKNPLSINLPTQAVLGLLREHPEVEMKLLDLVSDRVASALQKKSEGMTKERISSLIGQATNQAEKEFLKDYTLSQARKDEMKWSIDQKIEISGTTFFRARSAEFKKELRVFFEEQRRASLDTLKKELDAAYHAVEDNLRKQIRKMAREEFFSVLKEAREINDK